MYNIHSLSKSWYSKPGTGAPSETFLPSKVALLFKVSVNLLATYPVWWFYSSSIYLINASIVWAFIIPTSIFLRTSLSSTLSYFIFAASICFYCNSSNSFWCLSFFLIDVLNGELIVSECFTWSNGIPRFSLCFIHF